MRFEVDNSISRGRHFGGVCRCRLRRHKIIFIGFMFTLFGMAISRKANQQYVLALSAIQAEYVAHVEGAKEAMWLKDMIGKLGITQVCVKIHYESQSVFYLVNHQVYHKRKKYILFAFCLRHG